MKKSKSTKRALTTSIISMVLCLAMFVGTTFAWFTDTASTNVNSIQAGTLDVELIQANSEDKLGESLKWVKADDDKGQEVLWEPGASYSLEGFRIKNNGNLALKYEVQISGIIGSAKLLDVIDFTVQVGSQSPTKLDKLSGKLAANAESDVITITGTMNTSAGNEYQGLSIEGITITVVATQDSVEYDSTSNDYDKDAVLPVNSSAQGNLVVDQSSSENATVKEDQTISDSVMSVTYPKGIKLNTNQVSTGDDGIKKSSVTQNLKYEDDAPSESLKEKSVSILTSQAVAQYQLELPVDTSNDSILVEAVIQYTPNLSGVVVYHSGVKLPSTSGSGEYAEYDSTSGKITLHLYHASPIDIVYDRPGMATVTTADELKAALADKEISTIVLNDNISLNEIIDVEHDVTIDFNGKILTAEGDWTSKSNRAIDVADSKLIFVDSSANKNGKFVTAYGGVKLWGESASFELNDITIECAVSYAVTSGWNANNATVVMNSGKILGGAFNISDYKWKGTPNNVIINGGEINEQDPSVYAGIYLGASNVTINDGTFKGDGNPNIITIGSGVEGKLTVNGGSFTTTGTFPYGDFKDMISCTTKGAAVLKGGTFNVKPIDDYIADGYKVVENNNGTWTVTKS